MKKYPKEYSIFIPAYNEEKIIEDSIRLAYDFIELIEYSTGMSIQLIILDDGSTDETYMRIVELSEELPIMVIREKGPSRRENLIKHMIKSDSLYVGFMDCDLATELYDLFPLMENIKHYDIVTGSRYMACSKIERLWSRRIISFLFNNGLKILFGSKIRDHECGFKMWKTRKLREIVKHTGYGKAYKDRKMFWDSEMWIYAQKLNMSFLEIPIVWHEGGKSALRFRTELPMIKYILRLRWKLWNIK